MNNSIFQAALHFPEWLTSPVTEILSVLILMSALVVFFHLRAGSSYGVIHRLYGLLAGKSDFNNEKAAQFWCKQKDIEKFNALFNFKAKSLTDIEKFIIWKEKYSIDISQISNLNDFFNFEIRKIKKIKKWKAALTPITCLAFYLISIPLLEIASNNSALIKFKDDKQWMWVSYTEAQSYRFNFSSKKSDWSLNKSTCESLSFDASKKSEEMGLKPVYINSICSLFTDSRNINKISQIIASQKILWAITFLLWGIALLLFIRTLTSISACKARGYLFSKLKDKP